MAKPLDFANKVELTTSNYTPSKDGAVVGTLRQANSSTRGYLVFNDENIYTYYGASGSSEAIAVSIDGVASGTKVRLTTENSNYHCYFVPYK